MTITNLLKTHICEEIFQNGYPSEVEGKHPFDFFMEADADEYVAFRVLDTQGGGK